MSLPSIPNITPTISLSRADVVNLLLASIALEELGLAHVINAEGEKIQAVLGTLPGITIPNVDIAALLAIDFSVQEMLKRVVKQEMLLEFKLEEVLNLLSSSTTTTSSSTTTSTSTTTTSSSTTTSTSTTTTSSSTTTSTSTTTTTTATTTMTTTTSPAAGALCTFAVFANNDFSVASQSAIDANTQVNGNLTVTHSGNTFNGNTNVVGTFSDSGGNTYQNLVLNAPPVAYPTFNSQCLMANATLVLNGDQNITSVADAAQYQGQTVWINGSLDISGGGISITGGGIFATGPITVSGGNFTYTSTGCFALYSDTGAININNGPYSIRGLLYTAVTGTDIHLATSKGGSVCGALFAGRNVIFTGGSAVHQITNTNGCSPCLTCSSNPCLNP